jgi:hypothetical protein
MSRPEDPELTAPPLEQFPDPVTGQPLFRQRQFIETHGTHDSTPCPHCGRGNGNISQGINVVCGSVIHFVKSCSYCGKTIYYRARHEITIVASTHEGA